MTLSSCFVPSSSTSISSKGSTCSCRRLQQHPQRLSHRSQILDGNRQVGRVRPQLDRLLKYCRRLGQPSHHATRPADAHQCTTNELKHSLSEIYYIFQI